ncbi:MAG: hypothetical protein M3O30_08440 [Planctomycetota bacterium]|nr:hypothetical protein [Planctomycetota bacterium]
MATWLRRIASSALIVCAAAMFNGDNRQEKVPRASLLAQTYSRPIEVRLRRLHLVRPDLIFYPIDYQIVC